MISSNPDTQPSANVPAFIAAHRGSTQSGRKENSIEAFKEAIRLGAEWIELDIRICNNGTLICAHDPKIEGVPIQDLNWADIQATNLFRQGAFPCLQQVLEQLKGQIRFNLEIKVEHIEHSVVDLAITYLEPDDFVITSFLDGVVKTVKEAHPTIQTGLILGLLNPPSLISTRYSELFPNSRLNNCHADFVVAHYKLLRFRYLKRMQRGGWPVWVWTVNDSELMTRLFHRNEVHVIITDDVPTARSIRSKTQ